MEDTTTVTAPAVEGAPGAAPDTTPTTPATDSGSNTAEARIHGLTAERKRLQEKLEAQEARLKELEEQYKSEEQKRIEERAKELYGADLQRLEQIDAAHRLELDTLMDKIPEERRGLIAPSAPVHEQLSQARAVLALLQEKEGKAPIASGSTPTGETEKPIIQKAEYFRLAGLAGSHVPHERKEYDDKWPVYKQAMLEGRVK